MAIARTLKSYLERYDVPYGLVHHAHTESALDSAFSAHVPVHQLAKAVVMEDEEGYVVAVIPSDNRLNVRWVNEELERELRLSTEDKLRQLFKDCDSGAVPALASAYDLPVIWDDRLQHVTDIYIEAGDHEHLVHLRGKDFRAMMEARPHSMISRSAEMMAADRG